MIVYYTCDNCHTTFESVETVIPSTCPNCFREKCPHKVGAKIIVVPCVRNATETEIEWFENVQKQIADEEAIRTANQVFAEKIRMLASQSSRSLMTVTTAMTVMRKPKELKKMRSEWKIRNLTAILPILIISPSMNTISP